jgi:hypothetical protein
VGGHYARQPVGRPDDQQRDDPEQGAAVGDEQEQRDDAGRGQQQAGVGAVEDRAEVGLDGGRTGDLHRDSLRGTSAQVGAQDGDGGGGLGVAGGGYGKNADGGGAVGAEDERYGSSGTNGAAKGAVRRRPRAGRGHRRGSGGGRRLGQLGGERLAQRGQRVGGQAPLVSAEHGDGRGVTSLREAFLQLDHPGGVSAGHEGGGRARGVGGLAPGTDPGASDQEAENGDDPREAWAQEEAEQCSHEILARRRTGCMLVLQELS